MPALRVITPSIRAGQARPDRRQVKDCRNWPRPASRATARVAPTIHERNAQPCIVGAGLAPALGAAREAAIDPILEFLNLTPIGRASPAPTICFHDDFAGSPSRSTLVTWFRVVDGIAHSAIIHWKHLAHAGGCPGLALHPALQGFATLKRNDQRIARLRPCMPCSMPEAL